MRNISKYHLKHKIIAGLAALLLALFPYTAFALETLSIESNTPVGTPLFSGDIVEYSLIINELMYQEGSVWLRVELADGVIIKSESIVSGISAETALPPLPGEEVEDDDDEPEESPQYAITHSITPGNNGFIVLADAIAPGDYINFSAEVSDAGDIQVKVYTSEAEFALSHTRGVITPSPSPEPPAEVVFEPEIQKSGGSAASIAALIICALLFAFIIYLLIRKLFALNIIKSKRASGKGEAVTHDSKNTSTNKNDIVNEAAEPVEGSKNHADSHRNDSSPAVAKDEIGPDDTVGI